MRRPDAVTCNISRKELVFCEFPFIARKRLVVLGDCTNSSYILYHFILFKGFTVVQAVYRQHFISEARDRFPATPMVGVLWWTKFYWERFFSACFLLFLIQYYQYYPANNSYSIHLLPMMHYLINKQRR